jgi:hypothetical protein
VRYLSLLLFLLCTQIVQAQKICDGKMLRKAYLHARNNHYFKAIQILENSLAKRSNCSATYAQLVELYYRVNKLGDCANAMSRLYIINEAEADATLKYLLSVMKEYNDNKVALQLLSTLKNTQGYSTRVYDKLNQQFEEINFTMQMQSTANANIPLKASDSINIGENQSYPCLINNDQQLLFTYMDKGNENIYKSTFDTCKGWSKAIVLPNPPNTSFPEGSPRLSGDGYYLFITRCDQRSELGWDGGGCDIFLFYKQDDTSWSPPQKFGGGINTPSYEGQACLNSANNVLYFVSSRPGGFGGKDIYRSNLVAGKWQSPVNLGPTINTAADEESPFIHPDNESFYFASNGQKSVGGFDLFKSTISNDTLFSKVKNLGYPANTTADENGISVNEEGNMAWFSRNAAIDKANFKIWNVQLSKEMRALPITYLRGTMYDKFTKELLKDKRIEIQDINGNLLKYYKSNSGDASFAIPLLLNKAYKIYAPALEVYNEYERKLTIEELQKIENSSFHIARKMPEVIDTLYSATYIDGQGNDTLLYTLLNNWNNYLANPEDSLSYFINFTTNSYIDESFKDKVCFSEEGMQAFNKHLNSIRKANELYCAQYLSAYQINLQKQIKKSKVRYLESKETGSWQGRTLFKIDVTVVEHY